MAVRLGNALKVALVEFTPTDGLEDADEAVPQAVVTGSVAPTVPVATGATVQEEA